MNNTKTRLPRAMPLEQRFWMNVTVLGDDECWEWKGSKNSNGYGQLTYKGLHCFAHRLSYSLHNGTDYHETRNTEGKQISVCHTCDNRACVNPKHLWKGDQSQNMLDAKAKGRLSAFIVAKIEMGRRSAELKARKREERLAAGVVERKRDAFGRMIHEGAASLPPRQRDERGYFLPGGPVIDLTPLQRRVLNARRATPSMDAAQIASVVGSTINRTLNALRALGVKGLL